MPVATVMPPPTYVKKDPTVCIHSLDKRFKGVYTRPHVPRFLLV